MARSKEQWKAQKKRSLHQPQTTRPGAPPPGVRPSAPSTTNSALFQLGFPTVTPVGVAPVVETPPTTVKPDPIQTPSMDVNINVDSSVVIDLTEEDDEEEDEPMGQNNQKATISDEISTVEATMTTQVEEAVGGPGGESSAAAAAPAPVTEPRPQTKPTEPTSEAMPDLGEEVESDVDEAWPSVPSPVSSRAKRTKEEKGTTLEGARNTLQHSQNEQEDKRRVQDGTNDNEREGRISLEDSNEEMDVDVDVDEELPNQTPTPGKNTSTSPDLSSAYRIVELENLEDGEIYEEGAGTVSSAQVLHEIDLEHQTYRYDPQTINATNHMGIRPLHLRGKKQKKRGKKKTKRKLDAMQIMQAVPGETPPGYEQSALERITRPRLFGDTPPPGPYTFAMMKNAPRGEPVNTRSVFQGTGPAQFYPGSQFVGAPRPLMPPPQHPSGAMPPLPFEDSQILRVNREGNMEMLNGGGKLPFQRAFSEPPRYGGFKYRSAPNSPPRAAQSGPNRLLQPLLMANNPSLPPLPGTGRGVPPSPATKERHDNSDDFDLDSLRAAALRTKRPKISTPAAMKATDSSCSSSPSSPDFAQLRHSEPSSPEIDDMRAEILRSIQRNRKQSTNKVADKIPILTPSVAGEKAIENPESNVVAICETADAGATAVPDDPASTENDLRVPKKLPVLTLSKTSGTSSVNEGGTDAPSHGPSKSEMMSRQGIDGDKNVKEGILATSNSGLAKTFVQLEKTTPEYRPLTACSQSVVIRLSLEDFSPRKNGEETRQNSVKTSVTNSGQVYNNAIEEMRRQIAEHERKRRNTLLLENGVVKLSRQSSSLSLSPKVSPSENESNGTNKPQVTAAAAAASVAALPTQLTDAAQTATIMTGGDTTPSADVWKEKAIMTAQLSKTNSPTEQVTGSAATTTVSSLQLVPKQQELCTTSGGALVLPNAGSEASENASDEPLNDLLAPTGLSPAKDIDSELDLDAIRAEYEQCVTECEEADAQVARLSREMAELEKQLPAVATT